MDVFRYGAGAPAGAKTVIFVGLSNAIPNWIRTAAACVVAKPRKGRTSTIGKSQRIERSEIAVSAPLPAPGVATKSWSSPPE